MIKYTTHFQKKIITLFEEIGYKVRFEKGNFQSGYCIVQNQNVVIINKFFDTEAKINALLDILSQISVNTDNLSEKSTKLYKSVLELKEE